MLECVPSSSSGSRTVAEVDLISAPPRLQPIAPSTDQFRDHLCGHVVIWRAAWSGPGSLAARYSRLATTKLATPPMITAVSARQSSGRGQGRHHALAHDQGLARHALQGPTAGINSRPAWSDPLIVQAVQGQERVAEGDRRPR